MKAKKYKIRICDGVLEMSHGWSREIEEVCVPECNLFINGEGCFVHEDFAARLQEPNEEVEVDGEVCRTLVNALRTKEEAEKKLRKALNLTEP
jgi:hypothetical protein